MQTKQTVDYATDINKVYLKELRRKKYNVIPIEVENDLIKNAKNGDKSAEKCLVESNLRLVVNIAKRYKGMGVEFADLIQEGNLGIYTAIERFNISKGVRFSVYASWWIMKNIRALVFENKCIEINESDLKPKSSNFKYEEDEVFNTIEQVSDVLNAEEELIENETNDEETALLTNLLDKLDTRSLFIIESLYGINNKKELSLQEIANKLNVSSERVRQLRDRAMIVLRTNALRYKCSQVEN